MKNGIIWIVFMFPFCLWLIVNAMYYKHGDLRPQITEDQAFISFYLQADQFRKSFNTHVVSLSS